MQMLDAAAEGQGYVNRSARKRKIAPNPRTGQVHAKVMPRVHKEILIESKRRGVQQGVLIEEMWNTRITPHVYWQITEAAKDRGIRQGELIAEVWSRYQESDKS